MYSTLATRFRESVSKMKDYRMKVESEFNVGYPTGFLNFDFINGTVIHVQSDIKEFQYYSIGIPDGCMCMIIGRPGCGKTTWTIQTAANIIRPFKTSSIFHDDIEGGITESRKEILTGFHGEELKQRYLPRNTGITAENFYERVKMIYDLKVSNREGYEYDTGCFDPNGERIFKLEPTVYILDSIALLMPERYTDEEEMSGSMSSTAAAKTNSMVFKRVIPMLKAANIILMMINHVNMKIDISPMQRKKSQVSYLKQDESLPGGNTIIYLSNLMIRFDDNAKLKSEETFGISGSMVDITIVKSRNNRAGQVTTLVFDQETGFDSELSLFIMLKNAGRIGGAGAYLFIGDRNDIKFSQKQFKQKLREDEELRNVFKKEISIVLKSFLESVPTHQDEQNFSITNSIIQDMNAELAA